jgi:hypothetical protein
MRGFRFALSVVCLLASPSLFAGVPPSVVMITSVDDAYNFPSPAVGVPVNTTITLTYNANGSTGFVADVSNFGFQGTNAADFTVVGGSCGSQAFLSPGTPNCTVIVRYTPASAAPETAQLTLTCGTSVAAPGGFSLLCSNSPPNGNSPGSITLFGNVLAAAIALVPAPLLDPKWLTLLSVMLLGVGIRLASRQN